MIGDAILASGGVIAARVGLVRSKETRQQIAEVHRVGVRNADRLTKLADQKQDRRIRAAVEDYARDHPGLISEAVATEAMRDLLDAIIAVNLGEEHGRGDDGHLRLPR